MSVPTAAGKLYDVDTRLRPQGAQGPLVVTLDSFERYQREEAWTWEHMALLRARPVYGSDAAKAELERIVADLLAIPRDPVKLAADAAEMRGKIAAHKQTGRATSELQSLMRISYAVFCLKKKKYK